MVRFLDTDRLLPDPESPWVSTDFKKAYVPDDPDSTLEFGYAFYGAGPFYSFASCYHGFCISHPNIPNMLCPQVAPIFNGGMSEVSFKYHKGAIEKEQFYGTYYQGWRRRVRSGYVVTNMVTGVPFKRLDKVLSARLTKWGRPRKARFQGAYTAVIANGGGRGLEWTVCGYYGGLSNVPGARNWGIEQGQANDAGMSFARLAGLRSRWKVQDSRPFQIAKPIWKQISEILRAYTGFVIQSAGSSTYHDRVYLLCNGNWEQVYNNKYFPRTTEFEATLSNPIWRLEARRCRNFHMVDLLDVYANRARLLPAASSWESEHPNFVGNIMTLENKEYSSLNGDDKGGTWKTTIKLPDLDDPATLGAIAKCKTLCGGHRVVRAPVKWEYDSTGNLVTVKGGMVHNSAVLEMESPTTPALQFRNLFVVNHGVESGEITKQHLMDTVTADDIPSNRTLTERELHNLVSCEVFPNSDEKDDGLLPAIKEIDITNTSTCMGLSIVLMDGVVRKVDFMPVSHLLVDRRDLCLAAHLAVSYSLYGYGYVNKDPFGGEWPIFYTEPSPTAYGGQEHWHVPYKTLIGESYRIATGTLDLTYGWNYNATAKPNAYVHRSVSAVNPNNRYTAFDLQMRPFTFLPLFMSAEMCHEEGAAKFCRLLACSLIKHLTITFEGTKCKFGASAPSWATDAIAFHESIVTILLMAGREIESYTTVTGTTVDVAYDFDSTLIGSPSDEFWSRLAVAAGVDTVSDLITSVGVKDNIAQIPAGVLVAAAGKDPIGFAASMGIRVIDNGDDTYNIGPITYTTKADLIIALEDAASNVVSHDTANVRNVLTVMGMDSVKDLTARPKKYAKKFNWFALLPHIATATTLTVAKVREKRR